MNIPDIVEDLLGRRSLQEDLILWLSLEAFENIEGWRRWDTGDKGYSYPVRPDEEDGPTLILEEDDRSGAWDWVLYDGHSKRLAHGGHRLAGKAMEEGLRAYRKHFP